jgi:serine/threonine protein kinase
MTADLRERAWAVFDQLANVPPEERQAALAAACGDDAALQAEVEKLLAVDARLTATEGEQGFLQTPLVRPPSGPGGAAADLSFLAPPTEPGALGRLDHYEVLEVVGRGGMGVVLRARDTKLLRIVAIKVLTASLAASSTARQRFLREARAAAAIRHDHVVAIYAVCEDAPVPYLVMEFIDGCNLEDFVRRGGSLEVQEILRIGIQVASGLAAAHQHGLIHRDIKPANILLESDVQRVKLTDFGLARAADDIRLTQSGLIAGTPLYMAPEQAAGEPIDVRADLFSLGSVLYELCTGQPPFQAASSVAVLRRVCDDTPRPIREINPDIPEPLCRLIERLHAKRPADRPASAQEVADELRQVLAAVGGGLPLLGAGLQTSPQQGAAEAFSLEKLKNSDVLLSYAAIDDYPLADGKPGWVSRLHRKLEVRMEQLSGEKVHVTRLPENAIALEIEGELLQHLPHAKVMISVLSPPFIKSDLCRRAVERFWQGAEQTGGRYLNEKARLLKALKTAVAVEQMPRALVDIFSPLFGFEFFELDADTGRVREFDEAFGPVLKQRFLERVYDLAYDGCQVLSLLKQVRGQQVASAAPNAFRHWVYLATTTSDVTSERDRIKRELLERGHVVLPDAPLPPLARDVETVVANCLAKCTLAIHLLGKRYGVTPEDSSESIPAMQVRLTADWARASALERLIWMPGGGLPDDTRQRAFVLRVQEDPVLHQRAEIIEGNLNLLKKELIRRLTPPEEKPKATAAALGGLQTTRQQGGTPKLYLICDPKDEEAVEALEDYLFAQGLEVLLPAFDGDDAVAVALHDKNLLTCNAVLVYYGRAPRAWVDINLRELLKAAGYGRAAPIAVQAVYIAPPDDRRKDRFHSHQAAVIRQPGAFEPSAELDRFVSRIKEVCT